VTTRRAAILVARREFGERVRSRAVQVSTALTLVLVAAVAVLAGVLGDDGPTDFDVGAQGAEATAIAGAARAAGPEFDARVTVRRFESPADARAAVRDESVDAAIVNGTIVSREDPPQELEQLLQTAARQVRAGEALRSEGVGPAEARRALDPPPLETTRLDGQEEGGAEGLAFAASLILYMQLLGYGLAVASGVVEEKASRVVEVLLASIPPRALLAGKVAGIGLLGLLQLLITSLVGFGLAAASGAIELDGGDAGTLAVVLAWFLFGYLVWACLFAVGGAVVSRQEDLQSSTTVMTVLLVICYLISFPVLDDPDSGLAVVASMVPFSSPIVMPVRVAMGEVGVAEIAASLVLLGAAIAVLIPIGARIYENAVLRMGKPLKLREAWSAPPLASSR
jgi:ABC-2 type transport system permease protein